jgi:hypothetical protein
MGLGALQNFIDKTTVIPTAWLNSVDSATVGVTVTPGGSVVINSISVTGASTGNGITISQAGLVTMNQGLTVASGALTVSTGQLQALGGLLVQNAPFQSRGFTDNATSQQLQINSSGSITIGSGAIDSGVAGTVSLNAPLQVNGIPTSAQLSNTAPSAISTVETYIATPLTCPNGSITTGSVFRMTINGQCTSTVANVVTFSIRYGTAGTTADTIVAQFGPTAATSGTGIPFVLTLYVTFTAVGASGAGTASFGVQNNSAGIGLIPAAATAFITTFSALTTTIAGKLGISVKTAAATTSVSIFSTVVERVF